MKSSNVRHNYVRLNYTELEVIAQLADTERDPKRRKVLVRMFEKIERATARTTESRGLPIGRFLEIGKEYLGSRLIMPPDPHRTWWSSLSQKLKRVGIKSEAEARAIAIYASRMLRTNVSLTAEQLVYRSSEYLGLARSQGYMSDASGPLPLAADESTER